MPWNDSPESRKWLRKYLTPLVGATIEGIGVSTEGFPMLTVKAKDGKTLYRLEVSEDEEGNGPGFLFGLPNVRS